MIIFPVICIPICIAPEIATTSLSVINTDETFGIVCGFRGLPSPTLSMEREGVLITGPGPLSVTNPSQRVDNDCYQVVERTLQWGTQDTEERNCK